MKMAGKATTIKKDIRVSVPDYSQRKKIEVITVYQDNNYNLELTSRLTGISQALIRQWHKELGRNVFKGRNEIEVVASEVVAERTRIAEQVSLELVKARQLGIERLKELILKSNNLESVTKAVDALTRAIKEDSGDDDAGGRKIGKNATYNLINKQYNILKQNRLKKNGDNQN